MGQIAEWLGKLGLEQYAKLFAENDIEVSVLPHLSDQDLKDLGVSLGHRRKIFAAINKGIASVQALAEAERPEEPTIQDVPERRYVTVLFSDLVGSTALSTRLDPEDLRDVIAVYQRCVEETVRRFNGFVAKFMGDGALVYFGYPEAHEDDPEQAVPAGLELVAAVRGLQTPEPLEARVGIATGLVVIGDLIGSGSSREQAIVGKTPNLAARLQGIAAPSTVLIADSTRKLLGNLFEFDDLGGKDLKGIDGPERAWAVLRANPVDSRFDAFHTTGVTELVGRQEELELLLRRWSKVILGKGQVVVLSGEPGIGKSRLTAALLEQLSTEPHTRLRYFCSPQHTDSALYPIITQMERAAGFAHGDTTHTKLEKLDTLLSQSFTPPQDRALFAELLSLQNDGRYPNFDHTPQQRRQRTFEALTTQIVSLAEQRPVLMIFEDVHWIDPTSLEALGRGIDRIRSVGVLLIITHRVEFEPPWLGRPYVTALSLNRLGEREIDTMIDRVAGNQALSGIIRRDIIERTDGIPLFVEELTKTVLEAAGDGAMERALATNPLPAIPVPASLHASLMARLDRLGPAKEVAQIGAVIGREFSYGLLAAVANKPDAELKSALDRLVEAGLLFRQGVLPSATYLFKHALVQDAAFGSLLREQRRLIHARIAEAIESRFCEIAESQPELLGRHFSEAGLIPQAIRYLQIAGELAARRSANREAVTHFQKAQELFEMLPDRAACADQELRLLIALGPALMATRSSTAPEIGSVYARARELARGADRIADLFPTIWGAWLVAVSSGDFATARRLLDELFGVANTTDNDVFKLQAHHAAWPNFMMTGSFGDARQHIRRGLALYRRDAHGDQAFHYHSHDPAVCAYVCDALIGTVIGFPDQAVAQIREALSLANDLNHVDTLVQALAWAADLYQLRREPQQVQHYVSLLVPLLEKHGSPVGLANAMMLRGWAQVMLGDSARGITTMREGVSAWRATGSRFHVTYRLARAVEAHLAAGETEAGLQLLPKTSDQSADMWLAPEIFRIRGELYYRADRPGIAEEYLKAALETARVQEARFLELRAAMSLARLWRHQGKVQQARELLAPVYGWFTEGFGTRDLKEAKALLEELAT